MILIVFSDSLTTFLDRYIGHIVESKVRSHAVNPCGGMAEWLKAAVLKTVDPNGSGSSNLSPSAKI